MWKNNNKRRKKGPHLNRGCPHKRMLASLQSTWAENTSYRCWIRKSCQQDCSLDFDKLVAWNKTCNKTPNDQQKMIDKRDRQGQNRILNYHCCKIHLSTRADGSTRKILWHPKLPYSLNFAIAKAFQKYPLSLFILDGDRWYLPPAVCN